MSRPASSSSSAAGDAPGLAHQVQRAQFVARMQVGLVVADGKEGDHDAEDSAYHGSAKEIEHRRRRPQALFSQRCEDRPPEHASGDEKRQMLADVDGGDRVGRVVQGRNMPYDHHEHVGRPGDGGSAEDGFRTAYRRIAEPSRDAFGREAKQEQWRDYQDQQQVLEHVRGEEVLVAQRVDG